MDLGDQLGLLRGAVHREDHTEVVALLRQEPWPPALQLVGDALLSALATRADGAPDLARRCVEALRERDWSGDEQLAQALAAATGDGPVPALRPLPVDLDELAGVLEGDPVNGGGRIHLGTGEVWPQFALDYADDTDEDGDEEEGEDSEQWLWVDSEGSRPGYRDMERFIATLEDPVRAEWLSDVIQGRGAFRRFRDTLSRWPEDLTRWHAFSEDRQRGRARVWLADQGYTPRRKRRD